MKFLCHRRDERIGDEGGYGGADDRNEHVDTFDEHGLGEGDAHPFRDLAKRIEYDEFREQSGTIPFHNLFSDHSSGTFGDSGELLFSNHDGGDNQHESVGLFVYLRFLLYIVFSIEE